MSPGPGLPVGILLAAGRGARFGGDKLLAPLAAASATSVGEAACRNLRSALADVVAVVRPGDEELATLLGAAGARIVRCANATDGMGASLACGVAATSNAAGCIVALADMPWIGVATIARVAEEIARGSTIAAPFYRGRRGHPVGFGAACLPLLAALVGDEGARSVIDTQRQAMVRIEVDDPGILRDIDTPADLTAPEV